MDKKTERQFQIADTAIDRAVVRFLSDIEQMLGPSGPEGVAPAYIVERALLALCDGLPKLIDHPLLADITGPARVRLSNALLDYRDSLASER